MQSSSILVAVLYLMDKIEPKEADFIQKKLRGAQIPDDWADVILMINQILLTYKRNESK